jgi:hypothetical protein
MQDCNCNLCKQERILNEAGAIQEQVIHNSDEEKKPKYANFSLEYLGSELGKLLAEKNKAYGNSFEKSAEFLKLLYPDGVPVEAYDNMLLLVRIFDKQVRIATDKDALGENPFQDIAGYGLLGFYTDQKVKVK